jgi:Flp pilus assembly protein TadD
MQVTDGQSGGLCPDDALGEAMTLLGKDDARGLAALEALIADYPADARLHFLSGSVLAGGGRIEEAHVAMARAVTIAPAFRIARFQLGFLQYTSGDAASAVATWQPLREGPEEDALSTFAAGLEALAADRFDEAIDLLRLGMAQNRDNPPLNNDMAMLIEAVRAEAGAPDGGGGADADEPMSLTQLALQQSAAKSTRH